jgi:hypothetical protein
MKTGKFNIKKKENKNGKIKMKNFQWISGVSI